MGMKNEYLSPPPHQLFKSNSLRGDIDFGCCYFLNYICPFFTRHLEPFERIKERGFVSTLRRDSEDSLLTAELLAERMFVPVGHPATVPAKFAQLLPDDWLTRPRREEEEVQHGLVSWRSISSSLQSLSSSFHDDSWPLCVCMFCPCLSGFSSGSLKSCI